MQIKDIFAAIMPEADQHCKKRAGAGDHPPRPELLAPAGGPDAGYAALHFGADAVYLGLDRFSARADAENFTLESLSALIAYAHALRPARRVYLTLNTLVKERELPHLLETMAAVAELGVDALIVQDLGVAGLARRHFPGLRLHASTQLAVHGLDGVRMARRLGFTRVTLARELTLREITQIARAGVAELEVFAHGALCYSYSGLCLFSSMLLGRSGNRGRCAYLCRDSFRGVAPEMAHDFIFSMKDLALADCLSELCRAGVHSLKIEGRKKSSLYVAVVTRLYRRLLDGPVSADELQALANDVQVVFSREWTGLYLHAPRNHQVVDRRCMGHRGCRIGRVAGIRQRAGRDWLQFHTDRALELHDGLQIDLPDQPRPYGFAVTALHAPHAPGRLPPVHVPADRMVEVVLPTDHPFLPPSAPVYCSSSQAVKNIARFPRPRPGQYRVRYPVTLRLRVAAAELQLQAVAVLPWAGTEIRLQLNRPCHAPPARSGPLTEDAARRIFAQLQDTVWSLGEFQLANDEGRFVPVSALKAARRELAADLDERLQLRREQLLRSLHRGLAAPVASYSDVTRPWRWSLKTDQPDCLSAFEPEDWLDLDELVLEVSAPRWEKFAAGLKRWSEAPGRERIRLALPIVMREWERAVLLRRVRDLLAAGWRRWELSNPYGWTLLEAAGADPAGLDLAADWPLHVLNSAAAGHLRDCGITRITLSPEDEAANWRDLLPRLPVPCVAPVFQDTPLMISETCVLRTDRCRSPDGCHGADIPLTSRFGDKLILCRRGCRNILLGKKPLNLWPRRAELARLGLCRVRVDFLWRDYRPAEACNIWRALRAGRDGPEGHPGNYARGLA